MNELGTGEFVNFLKLLFVAKVNFCRFWRLEALGLGKFFLDKREVLWYDYSIIIGKKSALLRVGLQVA